MSAALGILASQLQDRLRWHGDRYSISTTISFADLLWDPDMHLEEIETLDRVAIIDSKERPRRLVVQRVRGELRYWLTTDRDPMSRSDEGELGVVASVEDAVSLCCEFLDSEARIDNLRTPRFAGGIRRGVD